MAKTVVHVSPVAISLESGMGRAEWFWREAFIARGVNFVHIGPSETGPVVHPAFFPRAAYGAAKRLAPHADLFFVHEPCAWPFLKSGLPVVVESHGIERRNWEQKIHDPRFFEGRVSLKTRILFPNWRLKPCDAGLKQAELVVLPNEEDLQYAKIKYGRTADDSYVFKNGVDVSGARVGEGSGFNVLWNGSWIPRKGTRLLIEAAKRLESAGVKVNWTLAGTGYDESRVLNEWPEALRGRLRVIPRFLKKDEFEIYNGHSAFVLPSLFEGQSLALLQAMAFGMCVIASNCCGQRDLIKDGTNGLLFEPGNVEQLTQKILAIRDDAKLRSKLGESARASVADRTWQAVAGELCERILQLVV